MTKQLQQLLASIEQYEREAAAIPPTQRSLRFAVYCGQGYVRGDQPRVELAAALYNARVELTALLRKELGQ